MTDRAPGQWPPGVQVLAGFVHRRRPAAFVLRNDRLELYQMDATRHRGLLLAGGVTFAAGALVAATVPFTDGGIAEWGIVAMMIGAALAARGAWRPSRMTGGAIGERPRPELLDGAPLYAWPRGVAIDWGRNVRLPHAEGEVVVKGDLPHRRGLRALLEG